MALRDSLAAEDDDARRAASAAASGRSITGLSGPHTEPDTRFARSDDIFGAPVTTAEPIAGERLPRQTVQQIGDPRDDDDPIFRRRSADESVERRPFGAFEQELAYASRPGYRRYWFNDRPGRIIRARQAGYAHVIDPDSGQPVSRITDRVDGKGQSSYLMEIPMEWYQQDMARQAAVREQKIRDIQEGRQDPNSSEAQYVKVSQITRSGQAVR
jgi:hypothetical protein